MPTATISLHEDRPLTGLFFPPVYPLMRNGKPYKTVFEAVGVSRDAMRLSLLSHFTTAVELGIVSESASWYPVFRERIVKLADEFGVSHEAAFGAFASLSPRKNPRENMRIFRNSLVNNFVGTGHTTANNLRCTRILAGESPYVVLSRKTLHFFESLRDPFNVDGFGAVACDTWHVVAMGISREKYALATGDERYYMQLVDVSREVADSVGLLPSAFQAVVWCVVRGAFE